MAEVVQTAIVPSREHKKPKPFFRLLAIGSVHLLVFALVFAAGILFADDVLSAMSEGVRPLPRIADIGYGGVAEIESSVRYALIAAIVLVAALGIYNAWRSVRTARIIREGIENVLAGDYTRRIPVKGGAFESELYSDFNLMVKTFRKKIAIQKYVSESTNKMIDDLRTGEYTKDAMRRDITIFFSDVRGFTSYAERHDPMNVVDTLNTLFDIQVDAVVRFAGDIDKFIGDEVMATFADPGDAFKAAMEIQKKVVSFNKGRRKPLLVGIGIHSGEAVIGALGSGDFYNWTAIGNTVNIGRRLCSSAAGGEVLVSEQAFAGIRTTRPNDEKAVSAKGISTPLSVRSFSL
jgi:class 3 adenylate cyclase